MKPWICCIITIITLSAPVAAMADAPRQTVEVQVNRLLEILGAPELNDPAAVEQKKATIRNISENLFDFNSLSRFTLGRDWNRLDEVHQAQFVALYRKLLESVYMDRLLKYKDEKVTFKKEITLSDNRAEVQTEILAAAGNILMNYRLLLKNNSWRVYDVIIENVSLAQNYRSQFSEILAKQSPDRLIDILQKKVDQQGAAAR